MTDIGPADAVGQSLLGRLALSEGAPTAGAANQPIMLDDPSIAYLVLEGAVDIFLFEQSDGIASSAGRHLLRAEAGHIVFGIGSHGTSLAAVGKGLPDSRLAKLQRSALAADDLSDELADQADRWMSAIGAAVAERIDPRPRPTLVVDAGDRSGLRAEANSVLATRAGSVVWVGVSEGVASFLDTEAPSADGTGLAPLSFDTWLTLSQGAAIDVVSSRRLAADGRLLGALDEFHALAMNAESLNRMLLLADVANEQTARETLRRRDADQARAGLDRILSRERTRVDHDGSALMAALALIGEREGMRFRRPPQSSHVDEAPTPEAVFRASGIRARGVRLKPEDRWWLGDSGAMLGFAGEEQRPVALVPHWTGRYRMIDPVDERVTRVDSTIAARLSSHAWLCYPALAPERKAGVLDLVRIAGKGLAPSFGRFALAGLLAALLTQAPAIAIGMLADWVLPSAASDMLGEIVVALVLFGVVGALAHMLQGTSMMRLEGRCTSRMSAAAWDRLLRLSPRFFRHFTAGGLAIRMASFQLVRDQLSGVAANALLSFVFLVPTLAILFAYDAALALVTVGLAALMVLITALIGLWQLAPQRRGFAAERRLAGDLLQFINGIGKLRAAGAEPSAFAAWARSYREQLLAGIGVSRLNEHLISLSAAMPALVGAALVAVVAARDLEQVQTGDFLVVYALAMTFFAAVVNLGRAFEAIAGALPGFEQIRPVLDELPEPGPHNSVAVSLQGEVRFDHVSFRYQPDTPLIEDVSFSARPGEFVAIVGESGSGKSTLMRLALGLEEPSAGSVYYDGRDLASLDRQALRRQLGVVTQDGALQPGSLLDNIIGMGDDLTIADAWRAVRQADIADEIAEMPMQLHTVVTEGSASLSGGQTQRLRIAAALVRKPRVIWLDEATSWLDARSQAQVMNSIERLAATRIVIAHRLSTVRHADRIYVMGHGRVVQAGSFDDLSAADGPFRRLVERQLT